MEEPTKSDIDAIFKRLKTISANKVCYFLIVFQITICSLFDRHVLIVEQKIQRGHLSLMVCLYVLIVRQDIVALEFICHLFVLLILTQVGFGFNFGMFDCSLHLYFENCGWFRAMQVGGNANAVRIISLVEVHIWELTFSGSIFSSTRHRYERYSTEIQQSSCTIISWKTPSTCDKSLKTVWNKGTIILLDNSS